LSSPNPKPKRNISTAVADAVKEEFHYSYDVRRMMPGKKDFVTIKDSGT
jgi:hypothetical protein